MEEEKEILEKYKLSEEEHNAIQEKILEIYFFDKTPVDNPKGIINIAPPASGKTGLNAYGKNQFEDGNVIIINSDELKCYHPKVDEIARDYPQYFTKITDQESNTWTSTLFDEALKRGYNVIFEGTGKNARILKTIKEKMSKYDVTVRGMAVHRLNCLISILERYWCQLEEKGWGRLVTLDHFYQTYRNMPETIDEIEKEGTVNCVQVLKRGEKPHTPSTLYDSTRTDNCSPTSKYATLDGRRDDKKKAYEYFKKNEQKMRKMIEREDVSEEEIRIYNEIENIIREIEKKTNKLAMGEIVFT